MADVLLSPASSPPTSPSPLPPRRPNKSRLRTLSTMADHTSTHSSSNQSVHSLSPSSETSPLHSESLVKSNYRSRFTEHFDDSNKQRPTDTLKASKSLTTIASTKLDRSSSFSSGGSSSSDFLSLDPQQRMQLTFSTSTPLQLPHPPRKYGSNGSVLTTTTTSHHPTPNNTSLNRADFIISRLETWHQCLKSVTSWVEQVAKISLTNSRGFSQKAYPHVDLRLLPVDSANASIHTIQAGFKALTMQIAAEQQAFSKCLERDHLPALFKLRRQVKDRVQQLKNDPALVLDELLRRAEVTRSKMTHLNRCCKQADKVGAGQQVEMDPWVANLLVLRQLKREVDEENRLRLLMLPIQKETAEFEQQVLEQIKPTLRYCYEVLAPPGSSSKSEAATPFESTIMPQPTSWNQFVQENKTNFVSETYPTKDYLKINYPNKFHPLVMTLLKGKMHRKKKLAGKQSFIERNYVLSQGGYLHQFRLDDNKVTPEKTLFIPNTIIVPSINLSQLDTVLTEYAGDTSNTFEICKPASGGLLMHKNNKDKISVFRTTSREELVTWCRLLMHIASGVGLSALDEHLVQRHTTSSSTTTSSLDALEQHPTNTHKMGRITGTSQQQHMDSTSTRKMSVGGGGGGSSTITTNTAFVSAVSSSASPSPARSLRSVKTEESFNEPAAYNKSCTTPPPPTTTSFNMSTTTPLSDVIVEEELYSTDAESFVTAIHHMDNDDDEHPYYHSNEEDEEEDDAHALMDYFSRQPTSSSAVAVDHEEEDDDDAASIASNSTAKGGHGSNNNATTTNHQQRSPSIYSTSDAQSSLYFSSTSAPPSPMSDSSSIVSMPEFELLPQATHIQQQQQ